jgi:hypothetical protein
MRIRVRIRDTWIPGGGVAVHCVFYGIRRAPVARGRRQRELVVDLYPTSGTVRVIRVYREFRCCCCCDSPLGPSETCRCRGIICIT